MLSISPPARLIHGYAYPGFKNDNLEFYKMKESQGSPTFSLSHQVQQNLTSVGHSLDRCLLVRSGRQARDRPRQEQVGISAPTTRARAGPDVASHGAERGPAPRTVERPPCRAPPFSLQKPQQRASPGGRCRRRGEGGQVIRSCLPHCPGRGLPKPRRTLSPDPGTYLRCRGRGCLSLLLFGQIHQGAIAVKGASAG